jgi:hypothetical protein
MDWMMMKKRRLIYWMDLNQVMKRMSHLNGGIGKMRRTISFSLQSTRQITNQENRFTIAMEEDLIDSSSLTMALS